MPSAEVIEPKPARGAGALERSVTLAFVTLPTAIMMISLTVAVSAR